MPNFSAFNPNPDNLRTLIFGRDDTSTAQVIATDTAGRVLTLPAGGTINAVLGTTITGGTVALSGGTVAISGGTVAVSEATITAGTLDAVLGATITTGTLAAVLGATITAGTLSSVTSISQKSFQEATSLDVATTDAYAPVMSVTTSIYGTYSFFVYNSGPGVNAADAIVEISANGTNWYTDVSTDSGIAVGSVEVLVPQRFLKYTRLSSRSTSAGNATTVDVYFNGQGT